MCHPLGPGSGTQRRKEEGGRRGELEGEESRRSERTKQAAVSALCKSSEPLNCRAVKQNSDSPGIQESKALCPVVGDGGAEQHLYQVHTHQVNVAVEADP